MTNEEKARRAFNRIKRACKDLPAGYTLMLEADEIKLIKNYVLRTVQESLKIDAERMRHPCGCVDVSNEVEQNNLHLDSFYHKFWIAAGG